VIEVADRVVVLRDGVIVKDTPTTGVTVRDIASWMVGRQVAADRADEAQRSFQEDILTVDGLWVDMPGETVKDMHFTVRKGEIFGIGGLAGQGKLGIPNGIMGLFPAGGKVKLHGKPVPLNEPRLALQMGMGFVSEDRRGVGLLLEESLEWNIAFTAMQIQDKYLKPILGGLFKIRDEAAMRTLTEGYIDILRPRRPWNSPAATSRRSVWPRPSPSPRTCCSCPSRPGASTSAPSGWCWTPSTSTTGIWA